MIRQIFALLIVGALVVWFSVLAQRTEHFQTSAERGIAWLRSYPGSYGNSGVLWVLKDINEQYCMSDAFEQELTQRFASTATTPIEQAYFLGLSETNTLSVFSEQMETYDAWLLSSLACNTRPVPSHIQQELFSENQGKGYDLTHRYLALGYLEGLRCSAGVDQWKIRQLRNQAAQSLYQEARAESFAFSDLAAERAAFLLWGGHGNYVTHDWIDTIMRNQNEDGGWGASSEAAVSNPHTTALAVWTLVQTTRSCPL